MAKSFRELDVWQLSIELTMAVYQLTADFPKHELYGLSSQMRRAAVSISSNLAEGAGRETRNDFRHFVILARGSACELQTQMVIAVRLGYCLQTQAQAIEDRINKLGRMLNGLAHFLMAAPARSKPAPAYKATRPM